MSKQAVQCEADISMLIMTNFACLNQLEYREIELQLENYRDRSVDEDEQRESVRRESQQLRIRLTEMETSKIALERDMATLR